MWQLLIVFYFIFGTISYLLRRVLAQKIGEHNRLINAVFYIFFLLPATIILFSFFPHNLNIGIFNLILLLGGSLIWPVSNIIAFWANKEVDVSIFTIINNLSPIFTLAIALPFLHENLNFIQIIGIILLVFSGIIAAYSHWNKNGKASTKGIFVCILAAAILGIAVVYERFMLSRVDFGAYLVYGWGAQIAWAGILAAKVLKQLPQILKKGAESRNILLSWGGLSVLKSISFILALKISASASLISGASDFMSVAVVIAAFFYLKERQNLLPKSIAVAIGVIGLLLIAK